MIVTYIRSSSYNNYDYCQMQYFLTYVLGYQSDSGKKAELGTIVHKTLEVLAGLKKSAQDLKSRQKYIEVIDDTIDKYRIDKSLLLTDEIVNDIFEKSFEAYTSRSKHDWTQSDKKECTKLIWNTLKFNNGQFDPRFRNIIDPEPHFDIPIEEDWAKYTYELPDGQIINGVLAIKGTIDLVTKVADDVIEVIDWKTGRRLDWATGEEKDESKLAKDPQLLLYNYAISKLYPQYKQSIMTIYFIKDGGPFSMCFDKSDQDKFLNMLKGRFQEIRQNIAPKPISPKRDNWKCTKLCHFCKNNWEGTDKNMCIYIEDHIKNHGIKKTVEKCSRPGFNIGFYSAPGA
jgi:hypothetical protein